MRRAASDDRVVRCRSVFVALAVIFLILLAVSLTVSFYVSYRLAREFKETNNEILSPTDRAAVEQFLNYPLEIADEWRTLAVPSLELVAALEFLKPELDRISPPTIDQTPHPDGIPRYVHDEESRFLEPLRSGKALSETGWAKVSGLVGEASVLLQELRVVVSVGDYTLEIVRAMDEWSPVPSTSPRHGFERGLRRLALQAHLFARNRQWEEAMDCIFTLFRSSQRTVTSSTITHLRAFDLIRETCWDLVTLTNSSTQPALLRSVLRDLESLESRSIHNDLPDPIAIDVLSRLRDQAQKGETVDLSPGKPGRYYFWQTDPWHRMGGAQTMVRGKAKKEMEIWFSSFASIGSQQFRERARWASASFDLAMLAVAQKIEEIEGRSANIAVPDIKTYFPHEPPADPFTGSPYLWDATARVFYSPGPDGKDDRRTARYTPSSEGVGQGDIWLGGRDSSKIEASH